MRIEEPQFFHGGIRYSPVSFFQNGLLPRIEGTGGSVLSLWGPMYDPIVFDSVSQIAENWVPFSTS